MCVVIIEKKTQTILYKQQLLCRLLCDQALKVNQLGIAWIKHKQKKSLFPFFICSTWLIALSLGTVCVTVYSGKKTLCFKLCNSYVQSNLATLITLWLREMYQYYIIIRLRFPLTKQHHNQVTIIDQIIYCWTGRAYALGWAQRNTHPANNKKLEDWKTLPQ